LKIEGEKEPPVWGYHGMKGGARSRKKSISRWKKNGWGAPWGETGRGLEIITTTKEKKREGRGGRQNRREKNEHITKTDNGRKGGTAGKPGRPVGLDTTNE